VVFLMVDYCGEFPFVWIGFEGGETFCWVFILSEGLCSLIICRLKNRRFKSEFDLSNIEDHNDRKIERELSQQIEDAMLEEAAGGTGKPFLV